MLLITGLIIVGILLISFEIFVPGGVLGLLGVVAVLGAVFVAFSDFGFMIAAMVLILSSVLITAIIILQFRLLENTKYGKRIFLSSAVSGRVRYGNRDDESDGEADNLEGKTGECVTAMSPTGRVSVEGKTFEAYSQDGFLERGTEVEVVRREAFRVVVRQKP